MPVPRDLPRGALAWADGYVGAQARMTSRSGATVASGVASSHVLSCDPTVSTVGRHPYAGRCRTKPRFLPSDPPTRGGNVVQM